MKPRHREVRQALLHWQRLYAPPEENKTALRHGGDKKAEEEKLKCRDYNTLHLHGHKRESTRASRDKAEAISFYCFDLLPFERVVKLFCAHPEWWSA